jgi:chromosome partitioning protein
MKVLTLFNHKGGVGKTTSVQNIGAALARYVGSRVLLIDTDEQANLTLAFNIRLASGQPNIATYILQQSSLEETRIKYNNTKVDVIPSSMEIRKCAKAIEGSKDFPCNLKPLLLELARQYDYVVIDCPPAFSCFTQIALVACDRYYIPLEASFFSYEGLANFAGYIDEIKHINKDIKLGGIFATKFNENTKKRIQREIIRNTKEQLGEKILDTYIRDNIALTNAQAQGMPIFDYDIESNGAKDYHALTKEIWEKLNK